MKPEDLRDDEELVSKAARKRSAQAAKAFGERLTELNRDQLRALDLPPELDEAIADFQRFPSHGARRRQLLLIGKLLRDLDEDVLQSRLTVLLQEDANSIFRQHQAEQWRDRLIRDEHALQTYLEAFPDADRDELKTLLRRIRHSGDDEQAKPHRRALFRFLRDQH